MMWLLSAMAVLLCGAVVALLLMSRPKPEISPGWVRFRWSSRQSRLHSGDSGITGRPR